MVRARVASICSNSNWGLFVVLVVATAVVAERLLYLLLAVLDTD